MTDRLWLTGREDADRLLTADPFALLVGFALDLRATVTRRASGRLP